MGVYCDQPGGHLDGGGGDRTWPSRVPMSWQTKPFGEVHGLSYHRPQSGWRATQSSPLRQSLGSVQ
eukprot:1867624-Prymnesium_polylepis.2